MPYSKDGLEGLTDTKKHFLASYDIDGRALQFAVGYNFYTNNTDKEDSIVKVNKNTKKYKPMILVYDKMNRVTIIEPDENQLELMKPYLQSIEASENIKILTNFAESQ